MILWKQAHINIINVCFPCERLISIKINPSWIGIPYIDPMGTGKIYHTWIDPFSILLPTFMDIMIKNQTHIYQGSIKNQPKCQCSIKNQPTSTKTDPMGKYNVPPDGMGGLRIPGSPQSLPSHFCQATSRLGWRIVGLAQWLRCKDFLGGGN